jgi:UrcA family protein
MTTLLKTPSSLSRQSASGGSSHTTFRTSAHAKPRLIAALLGLSATLVMAAGAADSATVGMPKPTLDSQTIRFRYADLQTADGARALARRIRIAAAYLCEGDDPVIRNSSGFTRCVAASVRRAIEGLDAPLVSEALGVAPPGAHGGQLASAGGRPD